MCVWVWRPPAVGHVVFDESLFAIRCVLQRWRGRLQAGSEWQVERKEQTAERRGGTIDVLVIRRDEYCRDRMCVRGAACVQHTQ